MLIFLYGPDTFRLSRKLAAAIEEYKKRKKGLDFNVIDGQTAPFGDFLAGLRQDSLFQEKKFFVVKNPVSNKEFKEAFIDNIEAISSSGHNIVACQEGKVLKTDRLLTAMKKHAKAQEFAPLEGQKLANWVAGEFMDLGKPVNPAVAGELAERVGSDLWQMENEIQKIVHRITGRQITVADIEQSVKPLAETNIFKTVDAIARRDKKQALALAREHLGRGDHPLYLLAMVASQFRNLLLVKSSAGAASASRLGIHPYVFGKTVAQARRFGLPELEDAYRRICQADSNIKTGKVDPEAGLELLLAQI